MRRRVVLTVVFIIIVIQALCVRAQNTDVRVNMLYSFELGFGSYEIGGLDVDVYKLPLSYTFKLTSDGKLKLKVLSPISYGRFRFRSKLPDGTKITAKQEVIAYIPGVELQYKVRKNWHLKPFAQFGFTWSISEKARPRSLNADVDDSTTYIYGFGLKSIYKMYWRKFRFSIGNAIAWAANAKLDGDDHVSFGVLENGVEAVHPLGFNIKGYEPDLGVFFNYYRFLPDAKFSRFLESPKEVKNQYEIAGSIGSAKPLKIWFLQNPRIGAGYRFGDLKAFTINFGFPF